MLNFVKWVLPTTAALGLLLGWSTLSVQAAETEAAKSTIKGTVVDKDGEAVEGARISMYKPRARNEERPQGEQRTRPEPLATATSDEDGNFELTFDAEKVPNGEYRIGGGAREKGFGMAMVTIKDGKIVDKDGKPADLKITLGQMQMRRGGQGGQGGGNQ